MNIIKAVAFNVYTFNKSYPTRIILAFVYS